MSSEPKEADNKSLVFNGEKYGYWKDCMCININSIDRNVWNDIQNGLFKIIVAFLYLNRKHNRMRIMRKSGLVIGKQGIF